MEDSWLNSEAIANLVVLIQESHRSSEKGVHRFIEPAAGASIKATSKTHSIVFGRRGSGKSSLLLKAAADLTTKSPIAYIDLETFKEHTYPDVLLSILIQTFGRFEEWLNFTTENIKEKRSIVQKILSLFSKKSFDEKNEFEALAKRFKEKKEELTGLLHTADNVSTQKTQRDESRISKEGEVEGGIQSPVAQAKSKLKGSDEISSSQEITEAYQKNKIEFLLRHILEYQDLFRSMASLTNGDSFLFLDDLYYIKRSDQARVIDFFHRVAKGNSLWLKIGTVRHRSTWYLHGDPPYGLKLGDDAHEINLDLTLENFSTTNSFLVKILDSFVSEAGIGKVNEILVDSAIERLVLASGGVARDFLGVFNRSISVAQERLTKTKGEDYRGKRIGKEDINIAAGRYSDTKMDEFKEDIYNEEEHLHLEEYFKRIRWFCLYQANSNIFLFEKNQEEGLEILQELMDLRLIHRVDSHVTVSKRQGKYFEAYMLDLSAYSEMRKIRKIEELAFWKKGTNIRRVGLILDEEILLSNESLYEQEETTRAKSKSDSSNTTTDDGVQMPLFK